MRSADWRAIRDIGYFLGGLFFLAGIIAIIYKEETFFITIYPYRDLGILIFLGSFALLGLGFISGAQAKEEEKLEVEPVVAKPKAEGKKFFCRYCGKENKPDAEYCEACGKKL